jgi:hypothetical protein
MPRWSGRRIGGEQGIEAARLDGKLFRHGVASVADMAAEWPVFGPRRRIAAILMRNGWRKWISPLQNRAMSVTGSIAFQCVCCGLRQLMVE